MVTESLDKIGDRINFITNHLNENDVVSTEFLDSFSLELEEISDKLKKIKNEKNKNIGKSI
jgi:tetrahydromethanopterin S-methyltransferase subunit G